MDATVDDFLNEINELVPLKGNSSSWQECFDDHSGFHYYWNIKTDEVTWSKPDEYIPMKKSSKMSFLHDHPIAPSAVKIYKVGNTSQPILPNKVAPPKKELRNKPPPKKVNSFQKPTSDSEDEKIVLISSYGGDSESETEDEPVTKSLDKPSQPPIGFQKPPDNDDLLTKLNNRPVAQKMVISDAPSEVIKNTDLPQKKANDISGFSLVAGYSDSEEEDNEEIKAAFPIHPPVVENKISHSTLFPITQPIDVKDFLEPPQEQKQSTEAKESNEFDSKAFQRKKRIGIALVNTGKKAKENVPDNEDETERKGFGFGGDSKSEAYSSFQKGGMLFVKSDVLNPTKGEETASKDESNARISQMDIEELYSTLKEKLGFLSEGRPEVSPVQVMCIQAETLFLAMTSGGLKQMYLQKWLNETCADLIKLEKEATPDGWTLKWDRSHKRYFYQNQSTGEGQWEYPQPDVVRCDEAMDISTTPPPTGSEPTIHMSPPLPPVIRSPTPPPPPIISRHVEVLDRLIPDVPLPSEPPRNDKFVHSNEPLPPGVDLPELVSYEKKDPPPPPPPTDTMNTALDSFYSDIAAIEHSNSPPIPVEEAKIDGNDAASETAKKKKKPKVKLTQGLSMKKKGVSKMVEKWKNVQMGYDN